LAGIPGGSVLLYCPLLFNEGLFLYLCELKEESSDEEEEEEEEEEIYEADVE
jgi:hypothetical protein